MKIFDLKISEHNLEIPPDFGIIGKKIEQIIRENYSGQWLAIRGISLTDHRDKSRDWMIETIQKLGTDRYDKMRKGVHADLDAEFGIELHAIPVRFLDHMESPHYTPDRCSTGSVVGELLSDCYHGAIEDRGYPLRIDLLMIYDLSSLKPAQMIWTDDGPQHTTKNIEPQDSTTFQFENPDNKVTGLRGIVSIIYG